MTFNSQPPHFAKIASVAGAIGAAIYLIMITVTLAHIEAVSGHVPFDMRPFGYGPKDATAILDGLGPHGRRYYLTHQIPLDSIYPPLLALTLVAMISWLGQRLSGRRLVRFGIALSIGSVLFDYAENLGVAVMILSWPDIPAPLVYATSTATIAKSATTSLAICVLIGLAALQARKWWFWRTRA